MHQLTEDQEYYDERSEFSVLASYLGMPDADHLLKIQEEHLPLQNGDQLILCSDGLHRQLSEQQMVEALTCNKPSETIPEVLCEEAARAEFSDNVTVIFVQIKN